MGAAHGSIVAASTGLPEHFDDRLRGAWAPGPAGCFGCELVGTGATADGALSAGDHGNTGHAEIDGRNENLAAGGFNGKVAAVGASIHILMVANGGAASYAGKP